MDKTSVEIDIVKINKISELTGLKTNKEIIDYALAEALKILKRRRVKIRMLDMQGCGWGWDDEDGKLRQ